MDKKDFLRYNEVGSSIRKEKGGSYVTSSCRDQQQV